MINQMTSVNPVARLIVARRNAAFLIAFVYLQDIFWLAISRISHLFREPFYRVAPLDWSSVFIYIALGIIFSAVGIVAVYAFKPLAKIKVSPGFILAIVGAAVVLNFVRLATLDSNARYVSGGLAGGGGIIYGISQAFNLAAGLLSIRQKKIGNPLPRFWNLIFFFTLFLTVDGLASALSAGIFIFLAFDLGAMKFRFKFRSAKKYLGLILLLLLLLWIGFNSKFSEVPDYLNFEFISTWLIARFSIQAEQMYNFVAGQSVFNTYINYWDLILRSISNRVDLLVGNSIFVEYPRSVSEALYYDMMGAYDAGSSPGILLGTTLQGPVAFLIAPLFLAFLFLQLFYGFEKKISILEVFAYSFALKGLHSNFSEFFTVVSPTIVYAFFFFIGCLLVSRREMKFRILV